MISRKENIARCHPHIFKMADMTISLDSSSVWLLMLNGFLFLKYVTYILQEAHAQNSQSEGNASVHSLNEVCTWSDWSISLSINLSIALVLMSKISYHTWLYPLFTCSYGDTSNMWASAFVCVPFSLMNCYKMLFCNIFFTQLKFYMYI